MSQEKRPKLSVCIATYNMKEVLWQTVESLIRNITVDHEIIIYDDRSTDGTDQIEWLEEYQNVVYFKAEKNRGVGEAFNRAMDMASGDYVMLMCADDILIDWQYVGYAVGIMESRPNIGYVTRYYYQYLGWDTNTPVRAWRCNDPIHLANNPSGLVFRRTALGKCSNKMFIETSYLASHVVRAGWGWHIYPFDAIAVRVWASTSTKPGYYLKRRVSSPVMDWHEIGVDMSREYVSFLQIKNGFKVSAVIEEMVNFLRLRPMNLISFRFWFFGLLALATPRFILRRIPDIYRKTWGKWTTKKVLR